jgi:hypothetical protein
MVIFEEASAPGRGNHILVKRIVERALGKPLPVTIGWIGKAPDGGFSYFEPETNDKDPKIGADDLGTLQEQVKALYKSES